MAVHGRIQTWELLFQKFENREDSKVIEFHNDSWTEFEDDEKYNTLSKDLKEKVNTAWRHDTTIALKHFPEGKTNNVDPIRTYTWKNSNSYRSVQEATSGESDPANDSDDDWEFCGSDLENSDAEYFHVCEKAKKCVLSAALRKTFKTRSGVTCRRRKKFRIIDHTEVEEKSHENSRNPFSRKSTYIQDCRKKRSSFEGNYSGSESSSKSSEENSATHNRLEENLLSSCFEENLLREDLTTREELPTKTNKSNAKCSTLNDLSFSTYIGRLRIDSPSSHKNGRKTFDSKENSLPRENDKVERAEAKSERLMSPAHRKRKNSSPGEKSERSPKGLYSDCFVVLERRKSNVTRTAPTTPSPHSFKAENSSRLSGPETPTIDKTVHLSLPSRMTPRSSGGKISLDSSNLRKKRSLESKAYRALMKGKSLFDI